MGDRDGASRLDAFRRLAEARAGGDMVPLPRNIDGHDRRIHVRQTIREDHQSRIASASDDAKEKFDKLSGSLFSFFRGTALLFYRDMAGEDAWMPTVLCLGDVHPENFGVMPSADNVPFFGVNDFDEAYYAPFTWDLKRGAVGFILGAEEEGGKGRKKQRRIAEMFIKGYVEGMSRFARDGDETHHQLRIDNAPKIVKTLLEDSLNARAEWLKEDYHDEYGRGFRASKKLVPESTRVEEFQEVLNRFVEESGMTVPPRAGEMKVKDVAARIGQGTASLGLTRYYVLVEGPTKDGSDDVIIELKQARRSALDGLVPPTDFGIQGTGERITEAARVQLVNGDVFFGHVEHEDMSFMTRERSPYKNEIDLDELSTKAWRKYARLCGQTLAHAHALSDDAGERDVDIEPLILDAIGPPKLFLEDMLAFAMDAADRVRRDHAHFRADHALGAFASVDRVFR
ncbi:DUF2252 family protein [Phycicoccus sp. CMS6Z-2]|uniref:DUF2252 family protein n=2 Tax=Phycicoccus flavus TaxID=2502783 RepID=A0A8T6R5B6_9MICO|nr:DUF2252 family protein [Phycicoccus flavus]